MKHIIALSGGKDSTALALRLTEVEPRYYQFVCTPTGDELPEMIDHWKRLGELLGSPLLPVSNGKSLYGLIRDQRMLPNNRARWCTRILKLEPYYRWLKEQIPCVSYVGLRADETGRPGMLFPEDTGVKVRFPLQEWGWVEQDVWDYLDKHNVQIPARTDCASCYHQTLGEWWRLWHDYPDLYEKAEEQEAFVSISRGRKHTFRNDTRDTWPACLAELRKKFEAGRVPQNTIRTDDFFQGGRRKAMCRACSL